MFYATVNSLGTSYLRHAPGHEVGGAGEVVWVDGRLDHVLWREPLVVRVPDGHGAALERAGQQVGFPVVHDELEEVAHVDEDVVVSLEHVGDVITVLK